jgi:molecular chaperone IbpA|tara:strand:+ start:110 stop:520 length:411 start_codon:yes stop_codon:yes gene_type:complete
MTQIEAFGQFRPFSVGFDSIFDTLQRVSVPQSNYPPYNIVKKGESYFVELAVAGFQKKDINIEVEDSSLKISVIAKSEDKFAEIIHKGISTKDFVKTFALAEFVEVKSAELDDGILSIELIKNIPEEKKPKTIKIK